MRKIIILGFAVLMAGMAVGQEWKIRLGGESKSLMYNKSSVIQRTGFIGYKDNSLYLMRFTDEKKTKPYLVYYDDNLVEKAKVMLPNDDKENYYGGFVNENSVDVLMTRQKESEYQAFHLSYDLATLQPKGEPRLLMSFSSNSGERNYTFVSSSQSQEWLSVIFAVVKDDDAEWRINLYDTGFDELWSMEFHMDVIDDYLVTDSGEIVVGGFYNKKNSDDIRVQFAILDGEREENYSDVGNWDAIQTMDIVRYENGKIYCTGLLSGEELEANNSRWSSGFYSLVYDTKAKKVCKFDKVLLTKDDICDLCNVSRRNKLKILSTDKLGFVNSVFDVDGTVVSFERSFNLLVNGVHTFTSFMGMLVYRIDNNGKIVWYKVVNREVQAPYGATKAVNSKLIAHDGVYSSFYIDSPKNVIPKPNYPVEATSIDKAKQVLMSVTFDKEGNVTRQGIEIPSKSICIGTIHPVGNGNYIQLLSQQFKSNISFLKYE